MKFRFLAPWITGSLLIFQGFAPLSILCTENTVNQKKRLEQEISRLSEEWNQIRTHKSAIMDELEQLRIESELLERQMDLLRLQRKETEFSLIATTQKLTDLENELSRYRDFITTRLRTLSTLGPMYPLKILLSIKHGEDFLKAVQYTSALTKLDRAYLEHYRSLLQELTERKAYLASLQSALDYQVKEISKRRNRLEQVRRQKEKILAGLQSRGALYQQALQELTIAFNRLQSYVLGSTYEPLLDINKFKGLLEWPVQGPLIRTFGKVRLEETGTYIISRGISIRVPEGTQVRAVFDGQVRYADWYSAYGRLVILDHGHDIYSLYAHNQVLLIHKGDIVERGRIIALSGSTSSLQGPLLYFEIRRRVEAQNPLEWLRIPPFRESFVSK